MAHGNAAEILQLPKQVFADMAFFVMLTVTRLLFFPMGLGWNERLEQRLAACRTGWVAAKKVGNEISFSRVSSE